jgi:hypothetical protein
MGKGPKSEYEYEAANIVRASQVAQGMTQGGLKEVVNERPELKGRVIYYRVDDVRSPRGQSLVKFITEKMNYKPCTNGEQFAHCQGGQLFWAWHEQHAENMAALKMIGDQVKQDLAAQTKRQTSDALGYAFQAQEVHTEASVRQVNMSDLVK